MLKIKDNIKLEVLKEYGFKLEPEKAYYYLKENDIEIFVWVTKKGIYKHRHIYYEVEAHQMIVEDFNVLFDLINDGLVEKVYD